MSAHTLLGAVTQSIIKTSGCTLGEASSYALRLIDTSGPLTYEPWRHGGWYVDQVRYPSGACGCVSRNYPDKKWRIACEKRPGDHTYPSRDAAARAEQLLALAEYLEPA